MGSGVISRRPMGTCHYCNEPATTWDHIVPKSKGGSNNGINLVGACVPCNSAKGAKMPTCECYKCRNAVALHADRNNPSSTESTDTDWIIPSMRGWYAQFTPMGGKK